MHGSHHFGLLVLSIFVSIFSATMACQTAHTARRAQRALHRHAAVLTGALALGGGIWTTHFIGMLAFVLPARVDYSAGLTLFSLLPAFAASWLALRLLASTQVTGRRLMGSGVLVGLGIGTMHYCGMAAMQTELDIRYEPVMFFFSILVAVVLAILAMRVGYGMNRGKQPNTMRLLSGGAVMGIAIASMHYTGMASARFIGQANISNHEVTFSTLSVALILACFTIMVTALVVALNGLIRTQELYRRLREGSVRLRATLETAVDGIITIDAKGLIQDFNRSAERMFGWTAEEVQGKNIKMLMPEPYQSAHDGYLQNYLSSSKPKIIGTGREVVGLRKDGSQMPMRLAVGRVDLPGELLFVGFVSDISDRHALEASLREAAEKAEQAAAAKTTFLANMSHEIRTPMNSIIGFTELLLQTKLDNTQRTHLETVRQASKSLLRLINDILDTTKLEKGHFQLESIDFSLRAVAMQVESAMRLAAHAKQLEFRVSYPDELPEFYRGDPLRVLQILNNLVGNAIKFTETGHVELLFEGAPQGVHIQVRDTGIGMTDEQIELIFAPFSQADASISRRFGGTGLGTTIARQLVEQMGGSIDVESEPGAGSIFHVWLPLPASEAIKTKRKDEQAVNLPPLHVLIADDVPQNLELLALTLQKHGHTVAMAADGGEAVRLFKTGRFDVVLMDVHMPRVDGLQACRLIREYEQQTSRVATPIIALTASVMAEDRQVARQAGMDGFAVKPLDVPALLSEIARVVGSKESGHDDVLEDAAATPVQEVTAVDWETGESLWGTRQRHVQAVQRFLDAVHTQYPLSNSLERGNTQELIFSLHGIRGAAGNLSLPRLTRLAAKLETQLRKGGLPEPDELGDLNGELDLIRLTLQKEGLPSSQLANQQLASTHQPATGVDADARIEAMLSLQAVTARQEWDEALLETVCADLQSAGRHAEATQLREALDSFEFAQALRLLERLLREPFPTQEDGAFFEV